MKPTNYKIAEIFYSLKGEGVYTGTPMNFIRLSGCNLNCEFCDTNHKHRHTLNEHEIIKRLRPDCKYVVITGGEPLLQQIYPLTSALRRKGYRIHLETNGTQPPEGEFDWIAMSPKTIEVNRNTLSYTNEIKFLLNTKEDYKSFILNFVSRYEFCPECKLYIMPVAMNKSEGNRGPKDLIKDNVKAAIEFCREFPQFSLCMQLHKIVDIP